MTADDVIKAATDDLRAIIGNDTADLAECIEEVRRRAADGAAEQAQIRAREDIDAYLTDTHASLWGRAFDIIGSPTSREQCIDFILNVLKGLDRV